MASIQKEISIEARPEDVWGALREWHAPHKRLARDFIVDARLDGDDRLVTLFNGAVIRELLVGIDDSARRLAYAVPDGGSLESTHYNGSVQVIADGEGSTRLIWIVDVLPNRLAAPIDALMERGAAAIRRTLEAPPAA